MTICYFINTETNQWPIYEGDIRAESHASLPVSFVPPEPFAAVNDVAQPVYNRITEGIMEVAPQQIADKWYRAWSVVDLDAETIAANQAMAKESFIASVVSATQSRLDDFAKTRNYDGILSACTYASSSVTKFATEGQYCVDARDNTWATLYTIMGEVEAGTRPMPATVEEVMALLPVLVWP